MTSEEKDKKLAECYQHLCDAQDSAECAGELGLMSQIEMLRHKVEAIRFGQ